MRIVCANKQRRDGAECIRVPEFWYSDSIPAVSGKCPKVAGVACWVWVKKTSQGVCGDGTFPFVFMYLRWSLLATQRCINVALCALTWLFLFCLCSTYCWGERSGCVASCTGNGVERVEDNPCPWCGFLSQVTAKGWQGQFTWGDGYSKAIKNSDRPDVMVSMLSLQLCDVVARGEGEEIAPETQSPLPRAARELRRRKNDKCEWWERKSTGRFQRLSDDEDEEGGPRIEQVGQRGRQVIEHLADTRILSLRPILHHDLVIITMYTLVLVFTLIPFCRVEPVVRFPREGVDLSVIILASLLVFPMLGCRHSLIRLLAIFHVYVKWNAHFQYFYLLTLASRGTWPSIFGVKCKSCSAGTSICWSLLR